MKPIQSALLARVAACAIVAGAFAAPMLAHAETAPPAPEAAATEDTAPDIVVTGAREGQRKAVAEKRNADNTVEALYANDVGKLPDQNVAEALRRLPGLSVANDQGEGRYVIIRGIDPNLVNVSLNGQTLPAPEPAGRQVKLDDLPSAMIQSVVVSKSLLPSQDANAIGGEVAIRTLTAYDRSERFFLGARGSAGWSKLNGKTPWEVDGQVGGRFGTNEEFGAVVSANYSRRPIESENFQGSEAWSTGIPDQNGLRDYNLVRTRLGVVGNFDYRPSDDVKLYIRSSYSKFTDHETRDQNRIGSETGITPASATSGVFKATGTILVRRREEDDNTKSVTLGGEFNVGGGKLEASGGYTKAVKDDPIRSEFTFATAKSGLTVDYDLSTDPYSFTPRTPGFTDPSKFTLTKFNLDRRQAYEEIWQARVDYTLPITLGDDSSIKIGGKYLDRRKFNNQDKTNYKAGGTALALANLGYVGDTGFYNGMYSFGQRIDYFKARAYVEANPATLKLDPTATLADSLSSDYDVSESIVAGYAMATLKFGPLTLIPGVRVEHTEDKTKATVVNGASKLTDGYNSFGKKSYTDVFPGLNAKWDIAQDVLMRAAVTTAIGRPNYPNLAPSIVVTDDAVTGVSLGNPDLKPYKSVNLDSSLEYYPAKDSVFAIGLFYKRIDNPIYTSSARLTNVTYAGVTYPVAQVSQPINADNEVVYGIELNAQTQFTWLPGVWGGFGVSANYTHVEGHATAPGIRAGDIPLGFQSHDIGTAQLFYENYGFAARVAYSYRSKYLDLLGASAATDEYTDNNGQLDVHASYQITPMVTIFADGTNLTDAPWRRFIGTKANLVERERYDYSLRGGVQLHF
ncbi:TonB-dependent receptor [Sphingomonas populi]|uniref:TonB-dependent receptor n=1 Tax=Sphingomonas populi TaxID=2484750 RepID=A0A4Q6XT63_9SPHN|nr:TonB-dependent receptor [Sphingomonas populi]RZF63703.1 TonB-dependent receptor [Sphingomonas populi]